MEECVVLMIVEWGYEFKESEEGKTRTCDPSKKLHYMVEKNSERWNWGFSGGIRRLSSTTISGCSPVPRPLLGAFLVIFSFDIR